MRYRLDVLSGIVLAVVLALSASPVLALHANEGTDLLLTETNSMSLSIKRSILLAGGEAREIVYAGTTQTDLPADYMVSELIWDIRSLVMEGVTVSGRFGRRFRCSIGAWIGVNEGNGSMEDYDWLDPSTSDWTHWSQSDVDIQSAYSFDANLSVDMLTHRNVRVSGILGFKHDFWEWRDYGGTYVYSVNGFRDAVGTFGDESGIEYQQRFDLPYLGFQVVAGGKYVRASTYLLYSPFVFAEDEDHHILRNLYFREEFSGGDYFAIGGDLTYTPIDWLFISCAVDHQTIPEFTGDLYQREGLDGVEHMYPDAAGIASTVTAVSLSVGFCI